MDRTLARTGSAVALAGGVAAAVPFLPAIVGTGTLLVGIVLVAVAALRSAIPTAVEEEPEPARFRREARRHGVAGGLLVLIFLLLLVEVLAGLAGTGAFLVFGAGAVVFVQGYGVLLGLLVAGIAYALRLGLENPERALPTKKGRNHSFAAIGALAAMGLLAILAAFGLLPANPDRAPFILTGSAAALFYLVRIQADLPTARRIIDWLEHEERVRRHGLPRKIVLGFSVAAGLFVLGSVVAGVLGRKEVSIVATAGAMVSVLLATFSLGVTRHSAKLEEGMENLDELRKKRKFVLATLSLVVGLSSSALFVATFLAGLAQAGGVALFASLLDAFVKNYAIVVAVALVPLLATCWARLKVTSDVPYTDRLKAVTILAGSGTVVLIFFGTFVGSGLAQGSGIAIENAVLIMSAAALTLGSFVRARAQLPGLVSLARQQVKASRDADTHTAERIQRQMLTTYVAALLFVVGFIAFFAMTTLQVVDVQSNVFTDAAFFTYLVAGLVLLGLVLVRYFQGVNLDPAWRPKQQEDIGKRRLSHAELSRYIILGISGFFSASLLVVGVLVNMGKITSLGPLALAPRFATDFYVFAILLGLGPYGWYYNREQRRIRAIDAKFPEFLRDLAESQRAGMTLTEAVITASKGSYGALTPDIRKMSAQIEWGVAFPDALLRFSKRVRTPLIERTVSLIIQAAEAGGNVVDVLTAAADDSREIQQIVKERTNSMAMYVYIIYIAFGVFLTVIGVLNSQFIPEVSKAVAGAKGATVGGITFKPFDEQAFKTLFFHAAVIQGLGGGFVAGVMQSGKAIMGLRHAFILVLGGYIVFRFLIGA